ncbi:hypothetical protein AAK894_04480 [Lachnospiraceae bacterium 46-61]
MIGQAYCKGENDIRNMSKKKKEPVCDENCFECKYPDCVVDITPSEKKKLYNENWRKRNKEKMQAYYKEYNKNYYQQHKEEIALKTKLHRQKPEIKRKIRERERTYRLSHKAKSNHCEDSITITKIQRRDIM